MDRLPGLSFIFTLAAISLIVPLSVHLFLPAIPVVKAELGLSEAQAQLAFGISFFTMGIATLFYGPLADRLGRRLVLLSGLFLFLTGSVVLILADSFGLLLTGRVIQAAGAGCGLTLVRAIVRDAFGQQHLVRALAYLTMFYTMGPMLAPLLGGILIDEFGWRTLFVFAYVCGALITIGAILVVEETGPAARSGSMTPSVLGTYGALLTRVRFNAYVLQTGFTTATFLVTAAGAAVFMKELLQRPATEYGLYFLAFPLGFMAGNLISGRIGNKVSIDTMVLCGSLILAGTVGTQSALLAAGYVTPLTLFLPGLTLSLAQGIALPAAQAGAIAEAPDDAATAAGIGVFAQQMCGGLAIHIYGRIADGTVLPFIAIIVGTALGALVCGTVPAVMTAAARFKSKPKPKPKSKSKRRRPARKHPV